ncbi:hypothetical protein VNO77_17253 [Canavalia gladiata]|uniref:Uncharacterized protein n=1 Tax=Canavalia gladiata TaxID=3824 RepID=A0AAN9QIL1_CANGL
MDVEQEEAVVAPSEGEPHLVPIFLICTIRCSLQRESLQRQMLLAHRKGAQHTRISVGNLCPTFLLILTSVSANFAKLVSDFMNTKEPVIT